MVFERSINIIICDKMMLEKSRDYMNARRVTKEYEVVVRGLNKNYLSIPPTGGIDEMKQVSDRFLYYCFHLYVLVPFFRLKCGKNI